MSQNSATCERQLNGFGISLHRAILDQLISEIESAINDGRIRSHGEKYSLYDFTREILGKKTEREVSKRFMDADDLIVTFCDYYTFYRSKPTPVTDMVGLIYIAYTVNSEFSHNLRVSSARLILAKHQSSPKPINPVEHLERSLEATREALQNYPYTLEKLWKDSGIVNKSQVKGAIIRDFVEKRDYIWADDILCINQDTYYILILSFRSLKGADISQLPEHIKVATKKYFQYHWDKKFNRRTAQSDDLQLTLFDI